MSNRTCDFPGCGRPHRLHGYCPGHYAQMQRGVELRPLRTYGGGECSIADCSEPIRCLGWCRLHYERWRRYGDPLAVPPVRAPSAPAKCGFPGCKNERYAQGYCRPHRKQLQKGEELRPLNPHRKYVINHHFFDVIDTEEKAYWLGFITADGCVTSRNDFTVNLKAEDAEHLRKLSASLSSDYPVHPGWDSRIVRWHANSVPIVSALGALGVTPRKSATAQPWDGPADLMPHYWRGMVDGDGGMCLAPGRRTASKGSWKIYLVGSHACVETFARWACAICGSRAQVTPKRNSPACWNWTVGGNRMTALVVDALYGNCSISLDRKQALADTILAGSRVRPAA